MQKTTQYPFNHPNKTSNFSNSSNNNQLFTSSLITRSLNLNFQMFNAPQLQKNIQLRKPLHAIQQEKFNKYVHSQKIIEEINSSKSEDQHQVNPPPSRHRRELTAEISDIRYIKNMRAKYIGLTDHQNSKIKDPKFLRQSLSNKKETWQKEYQLQKCLRTDSPNFLPFNKKATPKIAFGKRQPAKKLTNTIKTKENKVNQENIKEIIKQNKEKPKENKQNLNQKSRFKIIQSNDINLQNMFFKVKGQHQNKNKAKIKFKQISQSKKALQKFDQQLIPIQKDIKQTLPIKIKHIRHNTELSLSSSKVSFKEEQQKKIGLYYNNYLQTESNPSFQILTLRQLQQSSNKIQTKEQISLTYENGSQVDICLKTLKCNQQKQKNGDIQVNISFLQGQGETETTNITPPTTLKNIHQQYKKGKLIGKGYFGEVYYGLHQKSGFVCALKYIDRKRVIKQDMVEEIQRQIQCQKLLSHPNICQIYQYYIDLQSQKLVIVMQLLNGQQLYKALKNKRQFSQEETADIIFQIASAVECMHKQDIIHNDIRPQNIIISQGVAKIYDFGLAVFGNFEQNNSSTFSEMNTNSQKGSDLWSLGVLAYEMLIGSPPFKTYEDNVSYNNKEIYFPQSTQLSSKAKDFITALLMKNQKDRPNIFQILDHPFLGRRKKTIQKLRTKYNELHCLLSQI